MRPIRISMTAFGPYRDTETVDFRRLEDRRLFVISGNTGAGKTTIFDAICFALYGSASGEDRAETRMLRSHFAADDVHTAVDYEFGVGGRTYRVVRQMPHKRGGNKNETGGKAELYETTSGQDVPCVDRFIVSDVNAKLESVIGLTKEQFSQIVMLPQGEFRKLLTSDTDNKEEILRRIFRTGLYEQIEERFQRRHRELQDTLKQEKAMQDVYVKQAEETLPKRDDGALTLALAQPYRSSAQVMDGLTQEAGYYGELESAVAARRDELGGLLADAENALRDGLALAGRFAQLADKQAQREQMAARQADIDALAQSVQLAEQAAKIEPYEEQAAAASRQVAAKSAQLERTLAAVAEAERGLANAEERVRVEQAREPERAEAQLALQKLGEYAPIVRTLAEREQELLRLQQEERKLAAERDSGERQLAELKESRRVQLERLKAMETELARLPSVREQYRQAGDRYKWLKEMLTIEAKLHETSRNEASFGEAAAQARRRHDEQEALWVEGQAGLLALHLHDGLACPVCGSEEHPHKAPAAVNIPSREQIQALKEQLRVAEQVLSEAAAQAAASAELRGSKVAAMDELGLSDAIPWTEQLAQAEASGKALRADKDKLEALEREVEPLKTSLEQAEQAHEKLTADRERLQEKLHRITLDRSTKQSLLESELGRVPEDVRTPARLEARIGETAALLKRLTDAWEEAQQALQRMQTRVAVERANAAQQRSQLEEAEQQRAATARRFADELAKSGFADDAEAYAAAKLAEPERAARLQRIEAFRASLAALVQQIEELERELAGREAPALEALHEAIAALKAQAEGAVAELHAAQRHKQEAERLLAAIAKSHAQFNELELQHQSVSDIYQMLKGDNALKISFERYILIEFLEQILLAANVRLQELSGGQFLLQRSDRLETRGKQSGLGLDVFDAYTGQNRDVKSMSGGEKFNASLCLALGMTDVIQAYQGGVSIEMMFIDEGFGSLDEESLGKAIQTLVDLQRAGRMIGVISHVQELKQAFPAVLEVSKTKDGYSRTAFILK
ncbi:AAA family ATPase [Cohnella yongneupensis]|uniref:Nuclease SbcCD subunit C n=1 Tax=Cohnella yongneupensis TaxID=425006 RepID=A0ABW0QWL9_9BACL